jgi:transposase
MPPIRKGAGKWTKTERRSGPEARIRAFEMMANGRTHADIAREFRVKAETVRNWRDSPEGERYLAEARKRRDAEYASAHEDWARQFRELAAKAIAVLQEKMQSKVPFEALAAAKEIIERNAAGEGARLQVTPGAKIAVLPPLELEPLQTEIEIEAKTEKP